MVPAVREKFGLVHSNPYPTDETNHFRKNMLLQVLIGGAFSSPTYPLPKIESNWPSEMANPEGPLRQPFSPSFSRKWESSRTGLRAGHNERRAGTPALPPDQVLGDGLVPANRTKKLKIAIKCL